MAMHVRFVDVGAIGKRHPYPVQMGGTNGGNQVAGDWAFGSHDSGGVEQTANCRQAPAIFRALLT